MTRTYIITADGTKFVAQGAAKRATIKITAIILAMIFLSAAIIGLIKGASGDYAPHTAPTASSTKPINIDTAKKACKKAPKGSLQDCLSLYTRSAWYSKNIYTPKGAVLVKECFAQYRGQELRDCLTQEI